jgi:hypothetical protein
MIYLSAALTFTYTPGYTLRQRRHAMTIGAPKKSAASTTPTTTTGATRERSPNYPAIPLEEAVSKTKKLYSQIKRAVVQPSMAVGAWGYKGLTGSNRPQLAALKQYGFAEYDKTGNVKLSRRGLEVAIRLPESAEYAAALREAALAPAIFRDLHAEMFGASDEMLRQHLVLNKGFSMDGAKRAIQAYRDTLAFANLDDIGYNDVNEEVADMPDSDRNDGRVPTHTPPYVAVREPIREAAPAAGPDYKVQLSNGVTAELTFRGNPVTPLELRLLREFLEFTERAMQATSVAAGESSSSAISAIPGDVEAP